MIHIFIINPVAGLRDRSENIRQFLERKHDFSYLVFDTEKEGNETDIVKRMLRLFEDEKIRFYVCGGSGSFANAISGIEEKEFARVEMAHYPCGMTNDFIKNFGRSQNLFCNMDNLIRGEVLQVDYVKNIVPEGADPYHHVLFSTIGLTERVERFANRIKIVGSMNSGFLYLLSFMLTFLFNPTVEYTLEIDGEDCSGEYDMIYIGNSIC
ncbi:MAG TPA: diacylglycerol kinase family protein, partial [Lachnospiraceae bacterium]|nr:diacylglycerol kinase family protein [Lachnospiraceae bacterium]